MTQNQIRDELEKRRRAFTYMDGFRCAAGSTPIEPGVGADPDFVAGYRAGKAAKNEAKAEAERRTGYRLGVFRLADNS